MEESVPIEDDVEIDERYMIYERVWMGMCLKVAP